MNRFIPFIMLPALAVEFTSPRLPVSVLFPATVCAVVRSTGSLNLMSTLFGELTGTFVEPDILTRGGQFSIDYQILGGTGDFFRASGFGLSFVDFNPAGVFNNYAENGLLVFAVPEPGSMFLVLVALSLATVVVRGRRSTAAFRQQD